MTKTFMLFTLFFCSIQVMAQQSACDAILQHGLRNISLEISNEATVSKNYQNHCSKNFSDLNDQQLASIEVEVFGYGAGSGNYSRNQRIVRLSEWCETNENEAAENRNTLTQSSIIYGRAYDAFEKCIELQDNNNIRLDYEPSSDFRTINFNLQYINPTPSNGIFLAGVETEGFTYTIKSVDSDNTVINEYTTLPIDPPLYINNLATNILFRRNESKQIVSNGQTYDVLERGTITIQTSGKSFSLFFPEEYRPLMPEQLGNILRNEVNDLKDSISKVGNGGVGSIVASMLSIEAFQTLYNQNGQRWILADGQDVNESSEYYRLTEMRSVPDLRGIFLRGKNYDRSESTGNVDGDLALGTPQDDILKRHRHGYKDWYANQPAGIHSGAVKSNPGHNINQSRHTDHSGGDETRPRNVTVNYFIRIN